MGNHFSFRLLIIICLPHHILKTHKRINDGVKVTQTPRANSFDSGDASKKILFIYGPWQLSLSASHHISPTIIVHSTKSGQLAVVRQRRIQS